MDTLQVGPDYCGSDDCVTTYTIYTISYQEYGKYIWGPQADVAESQYAGLVKNDNALTAKDLGISSEGVGRGYTSTPTVSVADPLNSVTNYWTYLMKDGKPALVWEKTVYGFDDGSVKTVTSANVGTVNVTSSGSSSLAATTTSTSSTQAEPTSVPQKNIFQRIWDFIVSWFR
jgi:hypothetical protein